MGIPSGHILVSRYSRQASSVGRDLRSVVSEVKWTGLILLSIYIRFVMLI